MQTDLRRRRLPEGAYVNIYATNDQIDDIIADPRVQGVSLTGSERAGAAVAEIAGRNLKKVVLELGGSDPFLVLGSDDLDGVVDAAVAARMENTGQACNAAKRFIVADELYDDFVEKFTEAMTAIARRPSCPTRRWAALLGAAADRLEEQVKGAVAGGAPRRRRARRRVLPARRPDRRHAGQRRVPPGAVRAGRDGVRSIPRTRPTRLANDTPYGLGSYVYTNDPDQAARVADQIDAGMVFVNGVGAEGVELPFGGVKRSGFGRELGRFGIEEFVNRKLIRIGG